MWNSKAATIIALMAIIAIIGESEAKPPSRVTGGNYVYPGEFPFNVRLLVVDQDDFTFNCGGAILGPRHILTAGHCLHDGKKVIVYAGVEDHVDQSAIVIEVTNFVAHPSFRYGDGAAGGSYDIGILILPYSLILGGRLNKIDLPTHPVNKNVDATFAGWGRIDLNTRTTTLRKATIRFGPSHYCPEEPYRICGLSKQSGLCAGDSGSPVVSEGAVVGIASRSSCEIGKVHTYSNVYYYIDWIKLIMRTT